MSKKFSALLAVGSAVAALFLYAAPAQAQATRTWVSGVGDDANPCSRTAPCKTFAGAISKTAVNGEINCLDPAGFGAVTINKSITIDCRQTHGGILNAGFNGVNIPFNSGTTFTAANDKKTVRLRGLLINGAGTGTTGVSITGNVAGGSVFIEDSVIDGINSGTARGINDVRTAGGALYISNTVVRNTTSYGINVGPNTTGTINAVLDNVRVENASDTVFSTNVHAMIKRSLIAGNTAIGVYVENSGSVMLSDSVVSHSPTGLFSALGGTIRLSNSDVVFNDTGFVGPSLSYGNNRIQGNMSLGVTPTLLSPALQ